MVGVACSTSIYWKSRLPFFQHYNQWHYWERPERMPDLLYSVECSAAYLPVLVMIISVSRSWNLSQRSFVSSTHSTIFNSSQLHLDRIRILSSLEPFFFITWVAFGRLEVVESLLLWGDGGCCCWCEFVFGEMLLLWLPFWEDEEYLKLSLIFSSRCPSTLHRSISTSSWPLWFPGRQRS